jgi:enoyl-CoA hydratase
MADNSEVNFEVAAAQSPPNALLRSKMAPMTKFDHLEISRAGRVLTLAFNRPEKLNAFNSHMHSEFARAIELVAADPDSDIIVITGKGRAFSSGGDLDWQRAAAECTAMFEITVREAKRIVFGLIDCEKPIIAKINGPAVGLGATVALFCDISFMARSAYISDPHVNVGMVAGDGGAVIWPQLIGFSRAKELLFTGDRLAAVEAERLGLVNRAVDDAELDTAVSAFADRLTAQPQLALRYSKLTINTALRELANSIMDVGLGYESVTNASRDHREALSAIAEKRQPHFGVRQQPDEPA